MQNARSKLVELLQEKIITKLFTLNANAMNESLLEKTWAYFCSAS